jgi:hypothetical protein
VAAAAEIFLAGCMSGMLEYNNAALTGKLQFGRRLGGRCESKCRNKQARISMAHAAGMIIERKSRGNGVV